MAGPLSKPAVTTAGDSFRIWEKDRQRVEQDIVEGKPFEAFLTERRRFDAMFDFMLRTGLWTAATAMRPSGLKKNNGIQYSLLNGVECLREMAGIDTPANCGPLLKDAYLLERIGFTAEKMQGRLRKDQTLIDPESLLNHLSRFSEQDLEAGFPQHMELIRRKRWLRGGVYAVDGHDIMIPYGQGYEGAHHISDGAYGYKLLVLLNVQDDYELIVGYVLGGLLGRLNQTLGPLRQWLKILLMDRGYWGDGVVPRTQTGFRHRFREPGAGREAGREQPHPAATGGGWPVLGPFRRRAAVFRPERDVASARNGVASDQLGQ